MIARMEKVNKKQLWVKLTAKKQAPNLRQWCRLLWIEGTPVKVIRNKECDALNISCTDADLKMEREKHFY